jgi:hypothetical protein
MQYSIFAVDETPYCVWKHDLKDRNLRFIESVDHEHFTYLAATLAPDLNGEYAQRAAIALRTGYHHALETLFTLLCASFRAPGCVVGWIQKCQTHQLRFSRQESTRRTPQLVQLAWLTRGHLANVGRVRCSVRVWRHREGSGNKRALRHPLESTCTRLPERAA